MFERVNGKEFCFSKRGGTKTFFVKKAPYTTKNRCFKGKTTNRIQSGRDRKPQKRGTKAGKMSENGKNPVLQNKRGGKISRCGFFKELSAGRFAVDIFRQPFVAFHERQKGIVLAVRLRRGKSGGRGSRRFLLGRRDAAVVGRLAFLFRLRGRENVF